MDPCIELHGGPLDGLRFHPMGMSAHENTLLSLKLAPVAFEDTAVWDYGGGPKVEHYVLPPDSAYASWLVRKK